MSEPLAMQGAGDHSGSPFGHERRGAPRGRSDERLLLRLASGSNVEARMVNVSETGVQIELSSSLELPDEGQRVTLQLLDVGVGAPARVGEVIWVGEQAPPRVGIRFLREEAMPYGLDASIAIDRVKVDPRVAMRFPAARARRWQVLPFAASDDHVMVAAADAFLGQAQSALDRCFRKEVQVHAVDPETLRRVIERVYAGADGIVGGEREGATDTAEVDDAQADAVALYDQVFASAIMYGASDVHIDSFEESVRVRARVDGQIELLRELSVDAGVSLISRIKVMAGLDISERRAPQDGRLQHETRNGVRVQVRVAT
ncbi:MAG: ATPase, T2SS/T4P/T4SS family, partial [Planctomycetota bacterium]